MKGFKRPDTTESLVMKDLSTDFREARRLVVRKLTEGNVSKTMISETLLVFEALCYKIFEQRSDPDAEVTISGGSNFGRTGVKITFEGGMYISEPEDPSRPTPEDRVLRAYADKIDYSYQSGYNKIVITSRRSHSRTMVIYALAVAAAVISFAVIHGVADAAFETALLDNIVFPLEDLFTNAMLMVAAPVTILSLLKNLTDTFVTAERTSGARQLLRDSLMSSVAAVLLSIPAAFIAERITVSQNVPLRAYSTLKINVTLKDFITSLIPSDILTPFQMISPFPLIILAMLVTYALCSLNKHFDKIKGAIDACYALFTRMLGIVIFTMPFFSFLAVLNLLLKSGYKDILFLTELVLITGASMLILAAYYLLRLIIAGVPVRSFVKKLIPLLNENAKIASSIEAVPYNIRYCVTNYGIDRRKLEGKLPILAEINLDGNCFIIATLSVGLALLSNTELTAYDIAAIGALVFFLSLGAPNQPGSCLIGMMIVLSYMDALELMPVAIFCEMVFGWLLSVTNVAGDIVTIAARDMPGRSRRLTARGRDRV